MRLELAAQQTQVTGLLMGAVDTDIMASYDVPKNEPAVIVKAALAGDPSGGQKT